MHDELLKKISEKSGNLTVLYLNHEGFFRFRLNNERNEKEYLFWKVERAKYKGGNLFIFQELDGEIFSSAVFLKNGGHDFLEEKDMEEFIKSELKNTDFLIDKKTIYTEFDKLK